MKTKINFGITIEKDGKKFSITGLCPSHTFPNPDSVLEAIVDYVNTHAGTDLTLVDAFGSHITVTEMSLQRGSARSEAFANEVPIYKHASTSGLPE